MTAGLFVTGTDTGVGKTLVAAALIRALRARGLRVAGMKPVASGCERGASGLVGEDVRILTRAMDLDCEARDINPYAFEPPIAPHLAAADVGVDIDIGVIRAAFERLRARAGCVVVEGVGGWRVPVGPARDMADVARALGLPVVLVVGVRLGCLNHALLTAQAVRATGLRLAGWIANRVDPHCLRADDNVAALAERLEAPLLGDIPWLEDPDPARAARWLDLDAAGLSRLLKFAQASARQGENGRKSAVCKE